VYAYICIDVPLLSRSPGAPRRRGTLLVITYSYHPNLSRSPGAIHWRVALFLRGPKGPGEPYSSSLVRITPTCLDPQGPLGFQVPYTGDFFVPQGPQGPRETLLVIPFSYHPHLSRSPGAPRVPGVNHWGFLCFPGAPRAQGRDARTLP
jgi:hypothetical protein